MKAIHLKSVAVILSSLSLTACGVRAKSLQPQSQKPVTFSQRIQFAKAQSDVDAIELSLAIEGSRSTGSNVTQKGDLDTMDAVTLRMGKDGYLEAIPAFGMDLRGEGQCTNASCTSGVVNLRTMDSAFGTGEANLEFTTTRAANCALRSLGVQEDDLMQVLKGAAQGRLTLSLVENIESGEKYVAIFGQKSATESPFLRTRLVSSSRAAVDLVKQDPSGSLSRTMLDASLRDAQLVKSPFSLTLQLSFKNQPSTEMICTF